MKTSINNSKSLRIFAVALALLLCVGIARPAAVASAADVNPDDIASTVSDIVDEIIDGMPNASDIIDEALGALDSASLESGSGDQTIGEGASGVEQSGTGDVVIDDIHDITTDVDVHHDVTVDTNISVPTNVHHDVIVQVDTSRFHDNTVIRTRTTEITPRVTPAPSGGGSYVPASSNPKTGDLNNTAVWVALISVSALAAATVLFFLLRKKKV